MARVVKSMKPVNTKSPRMSFHLIGDAHDRVEKMP
jgi:hypothetical protein